MLVCVRVPGGGFDRDPLTQGVCLNPSIFCPPRPSSGCTHTHTLLIISSIDRPIAEGSVCVDRAPIPRCASSHRPKTFLPDPPQGQSAARMGRDRIADEISTTPNVQQPPPTARLKRCSIRFRRPVVRVTRRHLFFCREIEVRSRRRRHGCRASSSFNLKSKKSFRAAKPNGPSVAYTSNQPSEARFAFSPSGTIWGIIPPPFPLVCPSLRFRSIRFFFFVFSCCCCFYIPLAGDPTRLLRSTAAVAAAASSNPPRAFLAASLSLILIDSGTAASPPPPIPRGPFMLHFSFPRQCSKRQQARPFAPTRPRTTTMTRRDPPAH
jgi:hypothetical protein